MEQPSTTTTQNKQKEEYTAPAQTLESIEDDDLEFIGSYLKKDLKDKEQLEALRQHVFKVWTDCTASAWAYRCITSLSFLQPKLHKHPAYVKVMEIIKTNPQARFLDLGCCFGTDTRKVVLDGFPRENTVAIDVVQDYWKFGLTLYNETAETLGIESHFGDVIKDNNFASELNNTFDIVWTGLVLHVLSREGVESFLGRIHGFLKPGGLYFGSCVGSTEEHEWITTTGLPARWLHSKESLTKLLTDLKFTNIDIISIDPALIQTQFKNASRTKGLLEFKSDLQDRPKRILVFTATKN